jgi:2-oxo-4-hydroxy-4-carboxy--5-ureidoimidazoline (OHCU) decarboxylase
MINYRDEEDEFQMEESNELNRQVIEMAKKEFIAGCYDAYEILATKGEEAIEGTDHKDIQKAINRMMALFVMNEEYERCQFIKSFVDKHMPGFEIIPDITVEKELTV